MSVQINKSQAPTSPVANKGDIGTDTLHHLAFENSLECNLITVVSTGLIISVNAAACRLLSYSKAELMTKTRADIFDVTEDTFRRLLQQRDLEGHAAATVTAIKQNGKTFPAHITTAVFTGADGIEHAIFTIMDLSPAIRRQKKIDVKKEKLVAADINIARSRADMRMSANNEWIKYIAKTSYDVMWDWDIASGDIYVGDSIEEVFGYAAKNNGVQFRAFGRCLLPGEKSTVEKKLFSALNSTAKSWKDNYMFLRRDGSVASTISRASIVRDEDGKAIRMIGATQDISRQKDLETKLTEQVVLQEEHKFLLDARLSFDVIWDWNLLTNEIFIGEEFETLFGYTIKNNKGNIADKVNHLHPGERQGLEESLKKAITSDAKNWEHTYRLTRADGSIAKVFDKASIIRNPGGKAYRMIGAMQDLSRQKETEERLSRQLAVKEKLFSEYKKNFDPLFNISADTYFDFYIASNRVNISAAYQKNFGYPVTEQMTPEAACMNHVHPDEKEALITNYMAVLSSPEIEWDYFCSLLKADDSLVNLAGSAIFLRNAAGKAYRMIGYVYDTAIRIQLKPRLKKEILVREKQVAETWEHTKQIEELAPNRELKDIISLLLGFSKLYVEMAKRGEAHSNIYLKYASAYIRMAMEEIAQASRQRMIVSVKTQGLNKSIAHICQNNMGTEKVNIIFNPGNLMEETLSNDFKLVVFTIVQEQVYSLLKRAGVTEINIVLSQNKTSVHLTITYIGEATSNIRQLQRTALVNIKKQAAIFKGTASVHAENNKGFRLHVGFPAKEVMIKQSFPELTNGKRKILVEKTKEVIAALLNNEADRLKTNFSDYLAQQLECDYKYLSKIFSELEGTSIQQFTLAQKIEQVKKLLVLEELNLTEIAWKLEYSSVAHLSNQFKKITGTTPSQFKMKYK